MTISNKKMNTERQSFEGIETYYTTGTEKKTRIFWLHGYSLNASLWPDIWSLYPEASHTGIDLPFHGRSNDLQSFRDIHQLAERTVAIARHFNCDHIAGFSFGGILALQMVIRFPDVFKTLSLISSPVGGALFDTDAQLHNRELIRLYKEKGIGPWLTDWWVKSPPDIFTGLKKRPAAFAEIRKIIEQHQWKELDKNDFSYFTSTNQLLPILKTTNTQFYLYIGEDDMPYIKRCNELLFRLTKTCRRYYIPDCGHLPILEEPARVIEMIRSNLNSH